jgi:hypothetical protein
MNSSQLLDEQTAMRLRSANPEPFSPHTVHEARVRITLKQVLKRARALRLKKASSHRRYLLLKKSKKVLTRGVQEELRQLLIEFRALSVEMKAAKDTLRGIRATREEQSRYFQDGYRLGIEHAALQRQQQEIDKRKVTI